MATPKTKPMATPKIRIQSPAKDFYVKPGVVWGPPGFRIQLIIDEDGYLTDEPRNLLNNLQPLDAEGTHCPNPISFKGYRVRLDTEVNDPKDNRADPRGCRLQGGVWY